MVRSMCKALEHGGPDDEGLQSFPNVGLAIGHRRLSIIDLSRNGHQPMADLDETVWITFNGEIYNYPELKAELLASGVRFRSGTDTEVIIQGFKTWGTHCFEKLRGMFAFALFDNSERCIYLVRDTAGIKPLYYQAGEERLAFASEIKAFDAAGLKEPADARWPVWLLAFGNIPEPYTTRQNTFSLPKGHYLRWQTSGDCRLFDYRSTAKGPAINNVVTAQDAIQQYLQTAVKRQLIADAPIGVFLSGGLDSSLIALLANSDRSRQIKTVSIFFDEQKYDERSFQNLVANQIEGENFSHLVKPRDFETHLPQIMAAMDMPTTDGINSWFISKYAKEAGLKAVLSGIGADELFGGYPSFKRINYLKHLRRIPPFLFAGANLLNTTIYKRLSYLKYQHPAADYLFIRGLNTPKDIASILNMDEKEVSDILFGANNFPNLGQYDELQAAWFESNLYMQNQLLRDTDVMSMAHGLEVRVPFLDEDFCNVVQHIDSKIRFDNSQPKKLLIDSFKSILPPAVWNRPKMGFSFPLEDWMKQNESICDEAQYSGQAAKRLIQKFKVGKVHWSRVFALYQIRQHV